MRWELTLLLIVGLLELLYSEVRSQEGSPLITDDVIPFTTTCRVTRGGHYYAGNVNTTRSGHACQAWSANSPHYNYYRDSRHFPEGNAPGAGSSCRNPDYNWNGGTWCYTTNRNVRWQTCDVAICECKIDTTGMLYEGLKNHTVSNKTCQRWRNQEPHTHNFTDDAMFPDANLNSAGNKCRNPNASRPLGPWCYTSESQAGWEYCDVPSCDLAVIRYTRPPPTTSSTTATPPTTRSTLPQTTPSSTSTASSTRTVTYSSPPVPTITTSLRHTTPSTTTTTASTRLPLKGTLARSSTMTSTTQKLEIRNPDVAVDIVRNSQSQTSNLLIILLPVLLGGGVVIALLIVAVIMRRRIALLLGIATNDGPPHIAFDNPSYESEHTSNGTESQPTPTSMVYSEVSLQGQEE